MRWTAKNGHIHLCAVLALMVLLAPGARADNPRLALPRSHLSQPDPAPIFLAGYLGLGGTLEHGQGQVSYGGQIIFQPASAASFLNQLYQWNTALVLQIDYLKLEKPGRMLSADMVFRHYLSDRRIPETTNAMFLGIGVGGTEVLTPESVRSRYFSGVLEVGQEWDVREGVLLMTRFQFRYYNYGGFNYSAWSISGGVGLPLPW